MKYLAYIGMVLALGASVRAAEPENPVEAKLREALRNTMLQLRDVQGQMATLQATQVANEQQIKDLTAKNEAMAKQAIEDRTAANNQAAELTTRLEEQNLVTQKLQVTLDKWRRSYTEVTALAQQKENDRAKAAGQVIKLQRQVSDQQIKNVQMYKLGLEVLDRYERFGLGDALLAREPFVGVTKVKFQTLVQDYQDKLADQRITP